FKAFSQFSRKGFKFLFVHNLPVSVAGVNISKTGNYTILITVSIWGSQHNQSNKTSASPKRTSQFSYYIISTYNVYYVK
ncbi:hypothetical protein J1784_10890, partial [Rahnella sp. FRB 231]|nr:hypothetical protein [Rahnella ecdela]